MSSSNGIDYRKQHHQQDYNPYQRGEDQGNSLRSAESVDAMMSEELSSRGPTNSAHSATYVIGLRKYCRDARILTSEVQRKLCHRNVKLVSIMSRAAALAIDQCQRQFRFKRWNCTVYNKTNVFGGLVRTSIC
jgi:hypothetical protein